MGTSPSVLLIWELFTADGLFHDTNCILVFTSSWNGRCHLTNPSKCMVPVGRGWWFISADKDLTRSFRNFICTSFESFSLHNGFVVGLLLLVFILENEEYTICSSLVLLTVMFIARMKLKGPDFKQAFSLVLSISCWSESKNAVNVCLAMNFLGFRALVSCWILTSLYLLYCVSWNRLDFFKKYK